MLVSEADTPNSVRRVAAGIAIILVWTVMVLGLLAFLSAGGGVDYQQQPPAPTTTCTTFTNGQGCGYVCTR